MTADDIKNALKTRYCMPEWATVDEVPAGILGNRRIDILTMNLFPSKNQEIIGFEIKVSRSDLLRELKDSSKSDAIARHCDKWFLVTPKDLVKDTDDIPSTWGLMEYGNDRLRIKSRGEKINCPTDIKRDFVAAFLQAFFRERRKEIDRIVQKESAALNLRIDEKVERKLKEKLEHMKENSHAMKIAQSISHKVRYYDTDTIIKIIEMSLKLYEMDASFESLSRKLGHTCEDIKNLQDVIDNICLTKAGVGNEM